MGISRYPEDTLRFYISVFSYLRGDFDKYTIPGKDVDRGSDSGLDEGRTGMGLVELLGSTVTKQIQNQRHIKT